MDPIQALRTQITHLDLARKRDDQHLLAVLASQRERVDKAFSEVSLALVEQELALQRHLNQVDGQISSLGTNVLDALSDHESRISALEGKPPAA